MPILDQYLSGFDYKCIDSAAGVRLHFIGSEASPADLVSVAVSVDFGSSHLSCDDGLGNVSNLPVGLAHFMEHYLFWLYFDEHLIPLESTYIASPNAVVTFDTTRWGIRNALVGQEPSFNPQFDEAQTVAGICDIVQRFLTLLIEDRKPSESLIGRTVQDICNEIGHRHSNLKYKLELKLRESLYEANPVRHDILGGREALKDIAPAHVALAMRLIRANVRSVVVLAHKLTPTLISEVTHTVEGFFHDAPRTPTPVAPLVEQTEAYRVTGGLPVSFDFDQAYVLLGVKLLPLQFTCPVYEEFRRAYALSHLLMHSAKNRCSGLLSPHARAYFVGGVVEEDPFFYWELEQSAKVAADLKKKLLAKIKSFRDHLDTEVSNALASMIDAPHQLIRACNAADIYRLKLTDFVGTLPELTVRDVDRLTDELRETRNNLSLVYTEVAS